MGGSADKEGYVHKSTIEEIILSFELTIDVQEFLDQIPEEMINFESFCQLFEQPFDDSKSMLSMKSVGSFSNSYTVRGCVAPIPSQ